MKQFITQKQWDEIPLKLKEKFKHYPISIGDMVEFLGDDNEDLESIGIGYGIKCQELCDILWELCKFKLKDL